MSDLNVSQSRLVSNIDLAPPLKEPSIQEAPKKGSLGTDELSTNQTSSNKDTGNKQTVDDALACLKDIDSLNADALFEQQMVDLQRNAGNITTLTGNASSLASPPTLTPTPPNANANASVVQQVKQAVLPPPPLGITLAKAENARSQTPTNPPGLPTSDAVRAKFGDAKDDIKLFGKIVKGMSTEYKALLKALDEYHTAANAPGFNPNNPGDVAKLQQLLDRVDLTVQAYHGNRQGVDGLSQVVAGEKQLLKDVAAKGVNANAAKSWSDFACDGREKSLGADGPQYKSIVDDVRGMQNWIEKIPVGDNSEKGLQRLADGLDTILKKMDQYAGDRPEVGELRKCVEDLRQRVDMLTGRPELLSGRQKGFDNAMTWSKALQLAPSLKDAAGDHNRVRDMRGKVKDNLPELGKGAVNKVYTEQFKLGEARRAPQKELVVKFDLQAFPVKEEVPQDVDENDLRRFDAPKVVFGLNMDVMDPQLAQRSLASYELAQTIGLKVIVPVKLAVIDGSAATLMEKAEGRSNDKVETVVLTTAKDIASIGQQKQACYAKFDAAVGKLENTLQGFGYSEMAANVVTRRVLSYPKQNPPPDASKIPGMNDAQFKSAFGGVMSLSKDGETFAAAFARMGKDQVGLVKTDKKGVPLDGAAPVPLMSVTEFADMVGAGTKARQDESAMLASNLQGKTAWEAKFLTAAYGAIRRDGTIDPTGVMGGISLRKASDGSGAQEIVTEREKPYDIDYTDPGLVQQLTELHISDFLSGQEDRHAGNYFVALQPDGTYKVSAFDGDLSWGDQVDPAKNAKTKYAQPGSIDGSHARKELPRVIDTDMRDGIMKLKGQALEDFKAKLAEKMSATQIEAFVERLTLLQAHVSDPAKCKVIKPGEWAANVADVLKNPDASYAAREHHRMEKNRKDGVPFLDMPQTQPKPPAPVPVPGPVSVSP
jgi:hypothetical protein